MFLQENFYLMQYKKSPSLLLVLLLEIYGTWFVSGVFFFHVTTGHLGALSTDSSPEAIWTQNMVQTW